MLSLHHHSLLESVFENVSMQKKKKVDFTPQIGWKAALFVGDAQCMLSLTLGPTMAQ